MSRFLWLKCFLVCLLSFATMTSFSQTDTIALLIRNEVLTFNDGQVLQRKVFNNTNNFQPSSSLVVLNENQQVYFNVVNLDSVVHRFQIGTLYSSGPIQPNDTLLIGFNSIPSGIYRYVDPTNAPLNEYLGLSGILHVKSSTDTFPSFYWNVQEHQSEWDPIISQGTSPDLAEYNPDYFTINGKSDPDINLDTLARITGNVGQEIRIIMVNSGISIHSMHFHGYHAEIIESSKFPSHLGRSKDTFPLYPKELLHLRLIPDKPGEYPIHDHNLVAVTGGGIYHSGMFSTILIAP
jgi:hypothetical protein